MPALSLLRLVGPYLIAIAIGFGLGWTFNGWRLNSHVADLKVEIASIKKDYAEVAATAAIAAKTRTDQLQAQVAAIDAAKTKEIDDARDQNRRLAAAVADGARRLRVKVRTACPGTVPQPSAGAGLAADATAELGADARQAYFDLRAGLIEQETRLAACQQVLRQITAQEQKKP